MKQNKMLIRSYDRQDEKGVINLWYKCGLVMPWNNPERDIGRKLKVNPELFLVGTIGGEIVASVMGGYDGHRGWINYLAVKPELRHRGLAKEIMEVVENKIRAMGAPKINLQVRESNIAAISFYENVGYKNDNVVSFGKRLVDDQGFDHNDFRKDD